MGKFIIRPTLFFLALALATGVAAQEPVSIELSPATLALKVGDTATLMARVTDSNGNLVEAPVLFRSSQRRRLVVDRSSGAVEALKGGEYEVNAFLLTDRSVRATATVSVEYPAIDRVQLSAEGGRAYTGTTLAHQVRVVDLADDERDVAVTWTTSDPAVATVDRFGMMTAVAPGTVALRATAEGVTGEVVYEVQENPVVAMKITASQQRGRTGDLIRFEANPVDGTGTSVSDMPVLYGLVSNPDAVGTGDFPAAEVDPAGRFVAYKPGLYTVVATTPSASAHATVEILPRHVSQDVKFVGQGAVHNVRTSDLWVWEGVDGRDYAITGTHRAHGSVYWWDVTNPSSPILTDSVVVDARTTNDVKVSEDGSVCVFSREGASNRRNGIVIVDCRDPRNVEILATYDDELTGGVHNLFIYEDHVYAVNNGIRFDVINIADPTNPHRVGRFELDTPGHAIHDVWIVDGIAYTSNWGDGVAVIDIGGGDKGGSPSNPVEIARFRDIGGATHAAFPYKSPTGKFYIFMGDEIGAPRFDGQVADRTPEFMSGFIHIVDFTDPENPEEVARYEVPEAGSHNYWIEDDMLYAAFYQGGLRVVDISGELKGNLYHQGREVAVYKAFDPDGVVANAPFTWGPQLYKGNLFFAEYFSGLWTVQLQPRRTLVP